MRFTATAWVSCPKTLRSVSLTAALSATLAWGASAAGLPSNLPKGGSPGVVFPELNLGGASRGEQAVRGLGAHLPDVAKAYGKSAEELRSELRQDPNLIVDNEGRLLFADEELPGPAGIEASGGDVMVTPPASAPLADTFLLHSRPGSKRTIYLDFDGHVISKTAWNASYNGGADIIAPPFDIDGSPSTFNDTERTRIQQIWRRVAEDYAPFDVDVTTELTSESILTRSTSSDDVYGTRVLVSPISGYFGNYGGIAYVGAYNMTGDYYKPALVFPEKLQWSEKYIGEACSHECGHNLGLSHDGTTTGVTYYAGHGSGETGWAPIMGNSYYKNVTQWSRGEYANANNTQDDYAIIASKGLGPVPDEFGDTPASAGYLPSGTTLSTAGILGLSGDVDVIAFAAGSGPTSLSVQPMSLGPDLDVGLELLDADGALIASSNPTTGLGASLSLNLSAGTYFARIRGVGVGDPSTSGYSDYASKGYYTLSGTVVDPVGTVPPVAVAGVAGSGFVVGAPVSFDGSGSFDQDGVLVGYAWNFGDGQTATGSVVSHVFAAAGSYPVTLTVTDDDGLTASDVVVLQVTAPNVSPTAAASVSLVAGTAPLPVSFDGSGSVDPDGSIVSYLWDFGDGSATQSGVTASHTYSSAGEYTATLTVTDNQGATATTSVVLSVTEPTVEVIRIQSLNLTLDTNKAGTAATATVLVTNAAGQPIPGATVTLKWSGVVAGTGVAMTGGNGSVVFVSKRVKRVGNFTATITGLVKTGTVYDASLNVIQSAVVSGGGTL